MTGKMLKFCEEYVRNGENAGKAAIFAGYSEKTAYSQGPKMLKKVEISEKISEIKREYAKKHNITPSRILDQHRNIAFYDPLNLYDEDGNFRDMKEMDPEIRSAIKTVHIQRVNVTKKGQALTLFDAEIDPEKDLIACFTIKVYLHDKVRSLDFLSKWLGMEKGDAGKGAGSEIGILQVFGGYPEGTSPYDLSYEELEKVTQEYHRKIAKRKK